MAGLEEWSSSTPPEGKVGTEFGFTAHCDLSYFVLQTSDFMKRTAVVLLALALAAPLVAQSAPGQVRPRPAEGRDPEFKPRPSGSTKPKSQLVAPQHRRARAKFPVIDIAPAISRRRVSARATSTA